ncbi:MAG: discoidin domain-containing protein [Candidatus Pseudobacter hemicellulosilyticus]|uniref:Discoidin domain-containing protein n=1 Tax=Candidatus Pseudobacter hemicellulosilyticus TaxID=3121375 RepID=A0AAJ5WTB2_9BACT|nr:MAG: discoidin domain-containing protein [Pseudobacter sp.]
MVRKLCTALLYTVLAVPLHAQTRQSLNSDRIQWMLTPQSAIGKDSVNLYAPGYNTGSWVKAVVPGCVFTAYVEAGLEKDPNFGDNAYQADKSKYHRNFWYRTELSIDKPAGQTVWLNFEGINRKGEIFFNGHRLELLDGFMHRGKFDITPYIRTGQPNTLAVLVYWPKLPVPNYASPTYISSDGWDWMPSVPGLLQGITDDVYLSTSGNATLIDPWIRTDLTAQKDGLVSLTVGMKNHGESELKGKLSGTIQPGDIRFTRDVTIKAGETVQQLFDTASFKQLLIKDPALWWPNGYGSPNLYSLDLQYSVDGKTVDSRQIKFGIRKYTYDTIGNVLHISVNGERIFIKGGNWGMSEYLLRCRGEEYDLKVSLHQQMNYNMIRNWIGSVTDEEFYDACDKYGIMVWDDFWLNSHPNLPNDVFAFNHNAVEKIRRLRNHASIALWCGDNEGYPLPPLNGWLRENVKTFDGGDRWYHANSHSDALTGSGPWVNFHPKWYFTRYPGGFGGDPGWGFRTEIGTAVFPTFESFKKFMPEDSWWPRNDMWNKHFFGQSAFNGGPDNYVNTINSSYGEAKNIEDFCRKAQLVNYETNKAMYEGWLHHMWDDASGIMTWMSQSAYPSMVWQTYDYYYDLTGAYFGVKKACEPIHIQWSYADNSVKVINTTTQALHTVKAKATVYTLDGKAAPRYGKEITLNAAANAATPAFDINFNNDNLAYKVPAVASSGSPEAADANAVSDGSSGSRWSSAYNDNEWVYVDLGQPQTVAAVTLNWESAHARAYTIQVSTDARSWTDVYKTDSGKGGVEQIGFTPVTARYVKMQGISRATTYGYSLYDLEVFGKNVSNTLQDMQFIKLELTDANGKILSENRYWRSNKSADYTALNKLPKASLQTSSQLRKEKDKSIIEATVSNSNKSIAFAVRVRAVNAATGEQILPVFQDDNYFILLKGEKKKLTISFDSKLLPAGNYKLLVEPYNK